ncbi:MAG: rhodanese-like domain-containing protein [Pseudomonadota bacterium]|nr:rhodanese-like domain-containing protein [Pseudomonadota bacterium]
MNTAGIVTVVEAQDLAEELKTDQCLLIQVTSPEVYEQAHLPGAVLVVPAELVSGVPPASGRLPERDRLITLFNRIGLTSVSKVVVYDDEGGGWAGRLGWTLDVIGHRNWRYLNGGLQAWAATGLAMTQGQPVPVEPSDNANLVIDESPIAEIADVLAASAGTGTAIWDVRSAEEYSGQKQAAARAGHIPGAVNYDWLLLKDPNNAQRLVEGLDDILTQLGIHADQPIITHCQTHHRSGLSYMIGRILGRNIRAYHGSWSEWGNREDTPIENPAIG